MRTEIETRMGLDAVDIYGLSEVMGPGVGCECVETKDGLVLWEDHFYPEIVDPETGEVLPEGAEGELVLTSLTKEALPVIRYRTRDRTRLLPPTARAMRRLGRINGRTDDMLIIRGVNVFPTQIEELLLATNWCGGHYQIELSRAGLMDDMTIYAEARSDVWTDGGMPDQGAALVDRIKNTIGISTRVVIVGPDQIERTLTGKARRVVDKRPRE
jgi:phenylacetate-CoA ligase